MFGATGKIGVEIKKPPPLIRAVKSIRAPAGTLMVVKPVS